MKRSHLAWLLGLLGLMPMFGHASRTDQYPPIDDDRVESEHYELRRLLCGSCGDVIDVVYFPERDSFFASTMEGDVWQINSAGQLVDVARGQGDSGLRQERQHPNARAQQFMRPPKGTYYSDPVASEDEEKALPFLRLQSATRSIRYDWRDPGNSLYLHSYQRQGRQRARFLDFNNHGWSGTYGRGQFRLKHQGELLTFSALNRLLTGGGRRDSPDIALYVLPQDHAAERIGFLGLYGRRRQLAPDETGFYVVRPRTREVSTDAPSSPLHQRYEWRPVFAGFGPRKGGLRHILFVNGQEESPDTSLQHTLDSTSRPLPLVLDFFHQTDGLEQTRRNYLKLNETYYFLRPNTLSPDGTFYAKLFLDEDETRAAFAKLGDSKDASEPITLHLGAEWFTEGVVYHLTLGRGDEKIPLNSARLDGHSQLREPPESYMLDRLVQLFDRAIDDDSLDDHFMAETRHLVQGNPDTSRVTEAFASTSVKLMIARLKSHNATAAEALFYHYVEQILPRTGFHHKALDIASMGLVLGIVHDRPEVIDVVFERLLGGDDLNIQEIRNDVLIYNLACYYATQKNKEKLLQATAQAIELGKDPGQFLADEDFSAYWQNEDFLAVLYQR